jgi:ABC-type transporter Mla maintaining outer membrane lipid asymmetry ATPase subunit MlaF
VVMLFQGKIIFDGTVEEIYSSQDEHVQHFIAGIAEPESEDPDGEPGKPRKRLFAGKMA